MGTQNQNQICLFEEYEMANYQAKFEQEIWQSMIRVEYRMRLLFLKACRG
jgi:hypothetical protein